MIMIPLLILQIFLFPFTANLIMNHWVDSRRNLELQEIASHLGSSLQQLYSSLNHDTISAGNVTSKLDLPPFIEDYAYRGNATLRTALDATLNSTKILDITLTLQGAKATSTSSVTLGLNVGWVNSTLMSNSTNLGISGLKLANGTINLSFMS
jgi:hypothetical protein